MPLGHGHLLVLSQGTGEDLPLPHGGPPPPARLRAPLERLVHLQRMEGMDTYGGGSEGPVFPNLHGSRKEMQSRLLDDVFQLDTRGHGSCRYQGYYTKGLQGNLSPISLSTGPSSSNSLGSGLEGPKVHE